MGKAEALDDGARHPSAGSHMRSHSLSVQADGPTPPRADGESGDSISERPRGRYMPALDGIRALAVAAVVLYHLGASWMQGGLLGVTMFFVISGFIITKLLLEEFGRSGRIDLKGFWVRRARRLLPAIIVLIVAIIPLCAIFNRVMLTKMRPDILPSLFFVNNWWQILQNVSYFDALGDPSPLTHFWSLAIEEQFYLVWPPVLMAILAKRVKRGVVRNGVLAAAVVSALAMAVMYVPGADPSRVYYGTDTRMFSLLLGAWLAFAPSELYGEKVRPAIQAGGWIGLAGLVLLFVMSNGYSAFQYRGGMVLCSLLTMVVVAASAHPEGSFVRVFSARPLVWLGKRSYSIYLWHFPLLALMNPVSDIRATPWWMTCVQLMIVLAAAEASYRFIETPFRHGLVGRVVRKLREGATPFELARRSPASVLCGASAVVLAAVCLVAVPSTSAMSEEGVALLTDGAGASESGSENKEGAVYSEGAYDVLMIGDSVSLRVIPNFEETFPHGHIDAMKNRQFTTGIELLDGYLAADQVGRIVVVALGTNGLVTDENIDAVMDMAGKDRIVVFVNTRSPQPWVQPTNEAIARAAERYKNARVVDWYGYSEGKNELFDGDGTHLSSDGAVQYVSLIYECVRRDLPIHPDDHIEVPIGEAAKRIGEGVVGVVAGQMVPAKSLSANR